MNSFRQYKGFKKIKFNFEYNGKIISIDGDEFKTFETVINKYIMKINNKNLNNLRFYYKSLDITDNISNIIGFLFEKTNNVNIKVKNIYPLPSTEMNTVKKPLKNIQEFPKIGSNQNKSEIHIKTKLIQNNFPCENHEENIDEKVENQVPSFQVSFYCRTCNKFICQICKNNEHNSHLLVNIYLSNLEESLISYYKTILEDINSNIDDLSEKFMKQENKKSNCSLDIYSSSDDEIICLAENTRNKVNEIIELCYDSTVVNDVKKKNNFLNYKEMMNKSIENIEEIVTEVHNKYFRENVPMNYNGFKYYFGLLFDSEKKFAKSEEIINGLFSFENTKNNLCNLTDYIEDSINEIYDSVNKKFLIEENYKDIIDELQVDDEQLEMIEKLKDEKEILNKKIEENLKKNDLLLSCRKNDAKEDKEIKSIKIVKKKPKNPLAPQTNNKETH